MRILELESRCAIYPQHRGFGKEAWMPNPTVYRLQRPRPYQPPPKRTSTDEDDGGCAETLGRLSRDQGRLNDANETIGKIDDLLVSPDGKAPFAVASIDIQAIRGTPA